MQLYASLDLEMKQFCYILQHTETTYTWSFWSDSTSRPMDLSMSHPAFSGEGGIGNLIYHMRIENYPTFPVPGTSFTTYDELYPLYLQHKEDYPELYI